jgi:hypothetical protein
MTHYGVGIVIGSHGLARDSFFLSLLEDYEHEKNNYIFSSEIKELYYGYTRNMAILKRLLDEMGPFVEMARGSDVILVCRCVDKHSCEIVHYSPKIRVRHMEIDSPGKYFRKVFVYARSSQQYRHIVCSRPLNNWERYVIFSRTVRRQRYSRIQSLSLLGLLAIGFGCWVLGSISATWVSRMHSRPKTEN